VFPQVGWFQVIDRRRQRAPVAPVCHPDKPFVWGTPLMDYMAIINVGW
jgi:hypothetical protein